MRVEDGFEEVERQLGECLVGERVALDPPLADDGGDAFQRRVWALIDEILYGETTTRGELAESLGDRSRARDVGAAVGANPLSIVRPCHRVVGR
jgi:methylated-DNA-[protein]-cysteine S-methyltransferase